MRLEITESAFAGKQTRPIEGSCNLTGEDAAILQAIMQKHSGKAVEHAAGELPSKSSAKGKQATTPSEIIGVFF